MSFNQNPFGWSTYSNFFNSISDKKCQNILKVLIIKSSRAVQFFRNLPNVALTDENASVVIRLSKTELEDLSLQTTFQKIFDFETQHVIELHAGFVQHTDTNETTEQGIT